MAIVVTARGTGQAKTAAGVSSPTFTPAVNSWVITVVASDTAITSVEDEYSGWGATFTKDAEAIFNGNVRLSIWSAKVIFSVADSVRAANATIDAKCIAVYEVSGLADSPLDKTKIATGTSDTPSSTDTVLTAQADELLIGGIGTEGPDGDTAGTWNGDTTDNNQRLGTTGGGAASNITVASATKIVAATGTYSTDKTGITSRDWAAVIATYKAAAGGTTHYGAATLSGIGSLAGIGRGVFIGKGTLSGAGTLAAIGRGIFAAKATLTGTGTLVALGGFLRYGVATLLGTGNLVAKAVTTLVGKATLAGVGSLSAIGRGIFTGVATLTGTGTLVGLGRLIAIGKVALSGTGTLAGIGRLIAIGKSTLSGAGSLTAIGRLTAIGKATLAGLGALSAIGTLISGTIYYGILKRWTGAAWGKALLKVYLAGSWQPKPLKRWDGSAWKEVDATGV